MYFEEDTLDDLLHELISILLASKLKIKATRGEATEVTGVLLQLTNPLARLSRTEKKGHIFSGLGEVLWYLAGSNRLDFIGYYVKRYFEESDDGVTIHGAYGPRLFHMHNQYDQVHNVIALLRANPSSRRAVIQLFDASDIAKRYIEIPCTCTLQFMIRQERLHLLTYMRSNDAYLGLAHDIFAFTFLQEIVARSLNRELGTYKHAVGSLHLYDEHREHASEYIGEGIQRTVSMPAMPIGDPWPAIHQLLASEEKIRNGSDPKLDELEVEPYWKDLMRLLLVFSYFKMENANGISETKKAMSSKVFASYIDQKRKAVANIASDAGRT